jgi:fatty-acyl-CoA synthase
MLACVLALLKLGATASLVNHNLSGRSLAHCINTTGSAACLVGEEVFDAVREVAGELALPEQRLLWVRDRAASACPGGARDFLGAAAARPATNPDTTPSVRSGDTAFYVFTSGTTGLPKAALNSHWRWLSSGEQMRVTVNGGPDDVFYCVLPLYHGAAGMSLTANALSSGASIVLRRRFSASAFWEEVRSHRVTVCQYIGEICRYLLNQPERADDRAHGLRAMTGAGLSPEVWERFQRRFGVAQIFEGWGSTEANTNLLNVDNRVGSCGRVPFRERTNLRLVRYDVDTDSHPRGSDGLMIECRAGEPGELLGLISSPEPGRYGVRFEGYTSAQDTERKVLRDVFFPGDAWWRSGDLLRFDEDGYFWFVDRIGDTFRWKSENVSTQEVADALGDFPGIETINVYGVAVPGQEGRAGMAALVMQPGATFDPAAFHAHCRARLPGYAIPLFLRLSAQADITSTFKLRKVDLQRAGYDPVRVGEPLLVLDEAEGRYVPYCSEALARLRVAPFSAG